MLGIVSVGAVAKLQVQKSLGCASGLASVWGDEEQAGQLRSPAFRSLHQRDLAVDVALFALKSIYVIPFFET